MKTGQTNYTEEGLIILQPNVLISKNHRKPKMLVFDFTTIQMKKKGNFFQDVMDEMKNLFKFTLEDQSLQDPNEYDEEMY